MLYRIKFISDEVDGFVREIKIDSDSTFLDLNRAVLSACGYPDDQMTSFYICDEEWERKEQITREDMAEPGHEDEDLYVMSNTPLSDFIEEEEQKMEFVFDPFAERVFYLDVKEMIPGEHLKEAVVTRSTGNAPAQLLDMDMSDPAAILGKGGSIFSEEEEGEFYGESDFNSDDLDLEGFEFTDQENY